MNSFFRSSSIKLPKDINLRIADYELTELIRLIKDNPEFNFKLMQSSYQNSVINERLERNKWANNLRLLIKKQKNQ